MSHPRYTPKPCRTIYGFQLRTARRAAGWSLRDLADATQRVARSYGIERGVSLNSISRYETGEAEPPLLAAALLARALGRKLASFDPLRKKQSGT